MLLDELLLLKRPTFKRHLHVEVVQGEGVFLLAEGVHHRLSGRLYTNLAPRIDGRRTVAELIASLRGVLTAAEVHFAVAQLERDNYLVDAGDPSEPLAGSTAAWWDGHGHDARVADAHLRSASVRLRFVHAPGPESLFEGAFAAQGIALDGPEHRPVVVVCDDYLRQELADINDEHLARGTPWILARPQGIRPWIGPWFLPGGACWACLAHRLWLNRPVTTYVAHRSADPSLLHPPRPALPSSIAAAAHLLVTRVTHWLATGADSLPGILAAVEPSSLQATHHTVVQRPQCPVCGDARAVARNQEAAICLQPRAKGFVRGGGHRAVPPAETLAQYAHHVSPITGVVRVLQPIHTGPDDAVPVFDSGPNLARRSDSLFFLRQTFRARSGGKGTSAEQARAGGLAEAIERYSGVWHGEESAVKGTLRELEGDGAVDPRRILLFSERQHRLRSEINAGRVKPSQLVPEPFDPTRPTDWQPGWSLTDDERRWVPSALCYYGYPFGDGPRFAWADSNGCAAGNTVEEAVLQGFLELVERDAVALWWYNRVRRPQVDLTSFGEPYLARVWAYYESIGRELWVLDLTTDLGIPTFAAVSRQLDTGTEQIALGFGAHLDPRAAVVRAVSEMNQFLPFIVGHDSGDLPIADSDIIEWLTTVTVAAQPYLVPDPRLPVVRAGDFERLASGDLRDDVRTCVDVARRLRLDTVVVDQTRPDVGMPVVKVFVPGLRHFWARFGPGRLYDVPVRLGWLVEETPEEWLNPIPVFF